MLSEALVSRKVLDFYFCSFWIKFADLLFHVGQLCYESLLEVRKKKGKE